jgi:hypothetical protein
MPVILKEKNAAQWKAYQKCLGSVVENELTHPGRIRHVLPPQLARHPERMSNRNAIEHER